MDFLRNASLVGFRQNWPGNPHENGRFRAYAGELDLGLNQVARYLTRNNPQAAEKRRDDYRPAVVRDDIHQVGDWICWFGHACFLLQLDGVRYLIDPVWGRLGLLQRRVPAPYTTEEIGRLDYLLLSHDHRDHCDEATVRLLSQKLDFRVLTTLAMTELLAPWLEGGQTITEAGWYQRYDTGKAEPRVSLMPTQHWCRRFLTDTNRRLWGSFVFEGKHKSVWFGGDSGYSPHFAEVAAYFPGLDYALIGIGAYKPAWFMQAAHTSPEQAWAGFADTRAKKLIPMHYGTYDLSQEPAGEPVELIRAAAVAAGRAGDLVLPRVGEVVML